MCIYHPDNLSNNTTLRKIGKEILKIIRSARDILEHPDPLRGKTRATYFKNYKSLIKKFEAEKANPSKPMPDLNTLKLELQNLSAVINSLASVNTYTPNRAKKSVRFSLKPKFY